MWVTPLPTNSLETVVRRMEVADLPMVVFPCPRVPTLADMQERGGAKVP